MRETTGPKQTVAHGLANAMCVWCSQPHKTMFGRRPTGVAAAHSIINIKPPDYEMCVSYASMATGGVWHWETVRRGRGGTFLAECNRALHAISASTSGYMTQKLARIVKCQYKDLWSVWQPLSSWFWFKTNMMRYSILLWSSKKWPQMCLANVCMLMQ